MTEPPARDLRAFDPLHEQLFGSATGIPADIVTRAARRLGLLALVVAGAWMALRLIGLGFDLAAHRSVIVGNDAILVAAMTLSIGMFALSRSRTLAAAAVLDIGLLYVVAIAFLISLNDHYWPIPADYRLRGAPFVCWWILIWPVLVPARTSKTLLASFFAALTAPVAMKAAVLLLDNPEPSTDLYLRTFLVCLVAAGGGFVPSRILFRLSEDIGRAREMGSYRLMRRIGAGGMGEVWAAEHKTLARPAALKLIRRESLSSNPAAADTVLARFAREAKATAALRSPHTVVLYDYGTTDGGTFYYVMELLDGFDLDTLVKRFGPIEPSRVAHILMQVCHSLEEAHQRNLIHRDIKPANIHLCRYGIEYDFVKVLDFGLVKSELEPVSAKLTAEGMTSGTPAFMAPEMAQGQSDLGPEADLYALGCVAYFLLTGQLVFEARSPVKMLLKQIEETPVPPSMRLGTAIPAELEAAVMSCLSKDRGARPQSARALARTLASIRFEDPWTDHRAEAWWRTHAPADGQHEVDPTGPTEDHANNQPTTTRSLRKVS